MKKYFLAAALVTSMAALMVGCGDSGSSTGGGNTGGGSGNGDCAAAKGSAACNTCQETKCAAAYADAESKCADLYSCICACPANDSACQQGCQSEVSQDCGVAFGNLTACVLSSCISDCSTTGS